MLIKNETLSFLLPMISSKVFTKRFFLRDNFIGAFIGDIDRYEYDNEIILAYHIDRTLDFLKFDAKLCQNPYYTRISYDYPEKNVVLYVFKIPVELEEEYEKVLEGEYSKLSPSYKLDLIKFWGENKLGKVFQILFNPRSLIEYWRNKGIDYREICIPGEYWIQPILNQELFSIDNI